MSYDISFQVKVEGVDKWVEVADYNITWNVYKIIYHSSGWDIRDGDNGTADFIGLLIKNGIEALETHPNEYKQYEASNGWGTVKGTLNFFKRLAESCQEYPYARVFVS